jgi:RNA recognition motif-containing protein
MAGGQVWEDTSLAEWDPNDWRIFCGDLGNDVTDEVLSRAFNRFNSFVKAKVVRDKRSNKSRGYGFVSFKNPQDFARAIKEMNGKCFSLFIGIALYNLLRCLKHFKTVQTGLESTI